MSISMYSVSVPVCTTMLENLSHFLTKASVFIDAKKCDPTALTRFRLAPDMLDFTRQVQIACDAAKNGIARLSGIEAPKFEDKESTLEELQTRIQNTLKFIATVPANAIDGTEEKEITFPVGPSKTRTMQGEAYLTQWMLPNVFFHTTTAYAMLRHNGVDLGKIDYLLGNKA